MRLRVLLLLAVLLVPASCRKVPMSEHFRSNIVELDGYVASRPVYETRKKGQLDALRKLLSASSDPVRRIDLSMQLADEYFAYSFDSTQYYLRKCLEMAEEIGDHVSVISADTKNIAKSVSDRLNGKPMWPWFLVLSLLCFLTEIALLRFWGKPALNE